MKFVATEDIAAPIDTVWARVSDFDFFEQRARDQVKSVKRSPDGPVGVGTAWTGSGEIMGKKRTVTVTVTDITAPAQLVVVAESNGMTVTFDAALEARGPNATRLTLTTEAKAKTLTARLMLQSAKLGRAKMVKRYKARVSDFAARIEAENA